MFSMKRYIVGNLAFAAIVCLAVIGQVPYLDWAVTGFVAGMALTTPLLCLPEVVKRLASAPRITTMPKYVDVTYDALILAIFLANGWDVTGLLYLVHTVSLVVYDRLVENARVALATENK